MIYEATLHDKTFRIEIKWGSLVFYNTEVEISGLEYQKKKQKKNKITLFSKQPLWICTQKFNICSNKSDKYKKKGTKKDISMKLPQLVPFIKKIIFEFSDIVCKNM